MSYKRLRYYTFVGGNLVTWRSKKQSIVSKSSVEAKFRALALDICELLWLRRLLKELRISIETSMKLYCDNKAAINIVHNPIYHDKTKHVAVDKHFIVENIKNGVICMPFISTKKQLIDVLTKGLQRDSFESLTCNLGMNDIFMPT